MASANNNNNDNNNDDRKNIQNTVKVTDVNSYKIRYCDYCSNVGSETKENQAENCEKTVVILQERSIEEWLNIASILAKKGFRLLMQGLIGFRYKDSLFSNTQTISSFTTFSKHSLTTLVYPKQALSALHLALTLPLNLPSGSVAWLKS